MLKKFKTVTAYPNGEPKIHNLIKGFKVIDISRHFYPPTVIIEEPLGVDTIDVAFKVMPIQEAIEYDGYTPIGAEYFQKELCVIFMKVIE